MRNAVVCCLMLALVKTGHAADLSHESLAGLHVGDSEAQVKRALGQPQKETKPTLGQATGQMESTLTYPHLEVGLGDGKVTRLMASSPSHYATGKGVNVGDTETHARKVYPKLRVDDDAHHYTLNVEVKNGHVVEIYLGEGAE